MTCLCDQISAVDLREKITIRKRTLTAGTRGSYSESTTDYTEWAKVKPMGGREVYEQMRVKPGEAYLVTVRFRGDTNQNPFWTNDDRVILRTRELAIESVVDIEDQHRWIELRCTLNKAT